MNDSDESSESDDNIRVVKQTFLFGNSSLETKFWDDNTDEAFLIKSKITQIKIHTGEYKEKYVILGISLIIKNLVNNEEKKINHIGSGQVLEIQTLDIKENEYVTNFYIKFLDNEEYISQIGFSTNRNKNILVGVDEGSDKIIEYNDGSHIILGTFGHLDKILNGIGIYYIKKTDFMKEILFGFFIVRYLNKKNKEFKKNWDVKYKEIPIEYQYLWKMINLPDNPYYGILRFLI